MAPCARRPAPDGGFEIILSGAKHKAMISGAIGASDLHGFAFLARQGGPSDPQWIKWTKWGPEIFPAPSSTPKCPAFGEAKHDASADRLIWSDGEVWAAELHSFRDEPDERPAFSKEQAEQVAGR